MHKLIYSLLLLTLWSCTAGTSSDGSTPDTTGLETNVEVLVPDAETESIEDAKGDDDRYNEMVAYELQIIKDEWSNYPNPIIAKFKYAYLGDYPHIVFADDKYEYDFGQGANEMGDIDFWTSDEQLTGEGSEVITPYTDKEFRIEWAWKTKTFMCCSGMQEEATGELPSIVKIELTGN